MHRWSQLFIPTLREAPADAEVASHKFLVRAGYIRQLAAGIYSYLFLGNRSFNKIAAIVREEMDKIGQEFYLPALHPRELWEASGRWSVMGENMFRLKDRKGADFCLGFTAEEVMTEIARKELRSYKQLPQIWYQIQSKFRDEPRPRSGLLRVRQFMMKDSYSFDLDAAGLDVSYKKHHDAYCRIFDRCGLKYMVIEADSGAMGGSQSQEFMVRTPAGEDQVVSCDACNYAANLEKATSKLEAVTGSALRKVMASLSKSTRPARKPLKTWRVFSAFLRRTRSRPSPTWQKRRTQKLGNPEPRRWSSSCAATINSTTPSSQRPMAAKPPAPCRRKKSSSCFVLPLDSSGRSESTGPRGLNDVAKPLLLVDNALEGRKNLIAGANKEDYHLKNLTPGKDFQPTGLRRSAQRHCGRSLPELR